ncbi:hypothetical protein IQ243_29205 [Nostocales cyanobacterium LEGE 11386]|nr:hypothetical protein [Nostocales cyanobacterium LEGE 11386]
MPIKRRSPDLRNLRSPLFHIMEITIMTYATATVTPAQESVQELTVVEISFYDHEIRAGQKLIASISFSYDDDLTQPWVVMVNGEEIHRANTWARAWRYICTHHNDGTLPVQEQETPAATTDNEIMCQIANECEKFGFELLDDGIYQHDVKLGEVGYNNGQWWFIRASEEHLGKIPCDSVFDAMLALLIDEVVSVSCEDLLDKPFEQLTADEWRMLMEYKPVLESWDLVAA